MSGCPLQIISLGEENEMEGSDSFTLNTDNLNTILDKIPVDMKVVLISVVGAFRTGKSFLLNLFLRYLRHGSMVDPSGDWMVADGNTISEGNMNDWVILAASDLKKDTDNSTSDTPVSLERLTSFRWRAGQERQTTGVWMWSEPFFRKIKDGDDKDVAILLMDTQGMFDNETTMTLTAQIFGLSTLVSSYQIYNVDKRIQEDNLQHLALFSEYGRMALDDNQHNKHSKAVPAAAAAVVGAGLTKSPSTTSVSSADTSTTIATSTTNTTNITTADTTTTTTKKETKRSASSSSSSSHKEEEEVIEHQQESLKPFQRLDFLVRDWQNFKEDFDTTVDASQQEEQYHRFRREMTSYLDRVIQERKSTDLKSTREQIHRCFQKLDCFLLPHPGLAVTKLNYNGDISKMEPAFRALIDKYIRYVLEDVIQPKRINNREITAPELKTFFTVYANLFRDGEKGFPRAMTLLEATSEANNRNALDMSIRIYKDNMSAHLGKGAKKFVKENILSEYHALEKDTSLATFESVATMGPESAIESYRTKLIDSIEEDYQKLLEANAARNPFKNVELYILPVIIAAVSWLCSVVVDKTCSHHICERAEDGFRNLYLFIVFCLIIAAWRYIKGAYAHIKEILPLLAQLASGGGSGSGTAVSSSSS